MDEFKNDTRNRISHSNKPPTYICQDCNIKYTHFDGRMIILKDSLWNLIANKDDVLCDHCIEKRLKRRLKISDLWRNEQGEISGINKWFVDYLKCAVDENI